MDPKHVKAAATRMLKKDLLALTFDLAERLQAEQAARMDDRLTEARALVAAFDALRQQVDRRDLLQIKITVSGALKIAKDYVEKCERERSNEKI